jgi:hypothetical protein
MSISDIKKEWREARLLREPSDHPTINGAPERVPAATSAVKRKCAADGCERGAIVASKFCYDHLKAHWGEVKSSGKKGAQSRASKPKSRPTSTALPIDISTANSREIASLDFDDSERLEPVRYAPPQTELERARWRYQLSPQLSDDEVLTLHRANPVNERGVSDV